MKEDIWCDRCGSFVESRYKNPVPTVDAIILTNTGKFVLIERKNEPYGLALPGGFVDYGESCEDAILREVKEELGYDLCEVTQSDMYNVYSNPTRDPRGHNISIAYDFITDANENEFTAGDDALSIQFIEPSIIKYTHIAFDHKEILIGWWKNQLEFIKGSITLY